VDAPDHSSLANSFTRLLVVSNESRLLLQSRGAQSQSKKAMPKKTHPASDRKRQLVAKNRPIMIRSGWWRAASQVAEKARAIPLTMLGNLAIQDCP